MDVNVENVCSSSEVRCAIRSGSIDVLKKFVKRGCAINMADSRGWTPLHEASVNDRYEEIVRLLLLAGAIVDFETPKGVTPFYIACKHGCENIARLLIEAGCNVNTCVQIDNEDYGTHFNFTPLHIACTQRNIAVIRLLLESGADINAKDKAGRTPIHFALDSINTSAVRILIKAGADLKIRDIHGCTALHYASVIGNLENLKILIEHLGSDKSVIDEQTPEGLTMLMLTCQFKHYVIAEKLIEYGADTTLVDSLGLLALHMAARSGLRLFQLLLKHTPKDAIEKYASFKGGLTHCRSLPCVVIDSEVYESLEFLYNSDLSEEVLKCPDEIKGHFVSPIGYLLLHTSIWFDNEEKVRFLEFLLSYDFLINPMYELDVEARQEEESLVGFMVRPQRTISPLEAVIEMHSPVHDDCYCELFLSMILIKGGLLDKGLPCKSSRELTLFEKAAREGFVAGLHLLRLSECTEPDDVMEMFLRDIAGPHHIWTGQEVVVTKFLLEKCSKNFISTIMKIRKSLMEPMNSEDRRRLSLFLCICDIVKSNVRVMSLKRICRFASRKYVREQAEASSQSFRGYLSNINLPSSLSRYLLYEFDF